MHLKALYDRTDLIHLTTGTVRDIVLLGLALVTAVLIIFLGDIPVSLIAALTIPSSLLFAFAMMVATGGSANLISIGAIDFGILVDASVIVLEHIYRRLEGIPLRILPRGKLSAMRLPKPCGRCFSPSSSSSSR